MNAILPPPRPVRLRGRSFLALVLSPELPFGDWLGNLDDLARRSTGFFLGRPIVLDVEGLDISREQLAGLIADLSQRNVRIMGIEGARASMLGAGMPPEMRGGRSVADIEAPETGPVPEADREAGAKPAPRAAQPMPLPVSLPVQSSLIVETPVRSGQSIIFPEGDVTVLASVASGAEIIAGGSVHIYGALRGRVLAGSAGKSDARIFCRKLEAELIAIDGLYKTADDLEPALHGQPVQAWLDGDSLRMMALS